MLESGKDMHYIVMQEEGERGEVRVCFMSILAKCLPAVR